MHLRSLRGTYRFKTKRGRPHWEPNSTNILSNKKYLSHVTCDTWHVTYDMWHLTCDMSHVTPDMWQVAHGRGWTFFHNFSSISLTIWEKQCFENIPTKNHRLSKLINGGWRFCWTPPTSPGLLSIVPNMYIINMDVFQTNAKLLTALKPIILKNIVMVSPFQSSGPLGWCFL